MVVGVVPSLILNDTFILLSTAHHLSISAGVMHHRYSHMRVVLREIDFKLKIYQAPTVNQKKRWIQLSLKAEEDAARIQQEREELERLEQEAKAKQQAKEQAEKK